MAEPKLSNIMGVVVSEPNDKRGPAGRFFYEVVLQYDGDDCLIWPFGRSSSGYGVVLDNGRNQNTHRLLCKLVYGPPPTPRHEAAHSCGHGRDGCVAKKHLRWATKAENEADKLLHGTRSRGERCGLAKLTEDEVHAIRELKGKLSQRKIAAMFDIGQQTVHKILSRKTWGWLPHAQERPRATS